ncbi:peptidoglycan DD-metalloendopeptidase family protein [Candidatus Uhrbacteria bacterium]|nr:peptidoglycan DD-metalloendopeptidase family protein [Candidatus Uhrbacteria bacterium]
MQKRQIFFALIIVCLLGQASWQSKAVFAQDSTGMKGDVDQLDKQIKDKRSRVNELGSLIDKYQGRIDEQEKQQSTLENEVLILDTRITTKQLAIQQAKEELEALHLEILSLETNIAAQNDRMIRQKSLSSELVRRIDRAERVPMHEILLIEPSLSAFFDRLEENRRLQTDLMEALQRVKSIRQDLENSKSQRDKKRIALEDQKKRLRKEELALEAERNFKSSLASETKNKQSEFERVLYELQQQQQGTADDISKLESKLKDKLDSIDEALARGDVLLNWPVDPSKGITATFHDPTYPFRHLFEHPGTDVRASVGTSVKSAAGGYVAWNKKGRMYGNYTMVVHPGNMATVYAHLSKFTAKPDTYVERGDEIGLSGGRPGDPGAGLSTGPHLHFEVRKNGIPVNPENYLPDVE